MNSNVPGFVAYEPFMLLLVGRDEGDAEGDVVGLAVAIFNFAYIVLIAVSRTNSSVALPVLKAAIYP